MPEKIIIFGAGVVAQCCISYFKTIPEYEILGCTVDLDEIKNDDVLSVHIIPYNRLKTKFHARDVKIVVCIGYSNNNLKRQNIYSRIKQDGWQIGGVFPSDLEMDSCEFSEGSIIFPGSIIQPFSKIGVCSIIWPGSVVGHHSSVGDFTWLASNCAVGGFSKIGNNTFLGLNSTVSDGINIGSNNIIGAGTFISKNTENNSVYLRKQEEKIQLSSPNYVKLTKFGEGQISY